MDIQFRIGGQYPPSTFISSVSGKRYAVTGSDCKEIPMDMPYKTILEGWINRDPVKSVQKGRAFNVLSSKGDRKYRVTLIGDFFSCECAGFGWHRTCSHIDKVKCLLIS